MNPIQEKFHNRKRKYKNIKCLKMFETTGTITLQDGTRVQEKSKPNKKIFKNIIILDKQNYKQKCEQKS